MSGGNDQKITALHLRSVLTRQRLRRNRDSGSINEGLSYVSDSIVS